VATSAPHPGTIEAAKAGAAAMSTIAVLAVSR